MFGRKTLIAVLIVFGLVTLCVLLPHPAPTSGAPTDDAAGTSAHEIALKGLPYCGVSMQLQDVWNLAGYERCCDEIAAQGADTVLFVPSASMENGDTNHVYLDMRRTFTEAQLKELIARARADKLRVILMPIVLIDAPTHDEWRGTISPADWDAWFASYQDMISFYAHVAEDSGVSVLVVGSELVSSEIYVSDWKNTIRKVRGIFHGNLTYSSNWDHYAMVQFWDKLDMVGMNSYWKLGPDGESDVSVDVIKQRWAAIQKDLFHWQETSAHKPILLVEAGWCSLANASYEPWDYTKINLPGDLDLQKRLYEGFFQSWWGKPQSAGFMMWEWPPNSDGGPDDKGYTPRGKPADVVLKQWMAKPRWKVNLSADEQ